MEFRPSTTTEGRSAIEVWEGPELVATLYAQRAGLHMVCSLDWEPDALAIEQHPPAGVSIGLIRR